MGQACRWQWEQRVPGRAARPPEGPWGALSAVEPCGPCVCGYEKADVGRAAGQRRETGFWHSRPGEVTRLEGVSRGRGVHMRGAEVPEGLAPAGGTEERLPEPRGWGMWDPAGAGTAGAAPPPGAPPLLGMGFGPFP